MSENLCEKQTITKNPILASAKKRNEKYHISVKNN
jgi:hypothetical protein